MYMIIYSSYCASLFYIFHIGTCLFVITNFLLSLLYVYVKWLIAIMLMTNLPSFIYYLLFYYLFMFV